MELKLIDPSNEKRAQRLYEEAFPREERAPFCLLRKRARQGRADFWSLTESGEWIGMAYILRGNDLAYLFYFAIDKEKRGRGYGTSTIEALKKQYRGCRLFLALETLDKAAANYDQRVKRRDFYARCGLTPIPYRLKEASVIFDVMGIGGTVRPEDYKMLTDKWLGWPLKWIIDMRFLEKDQQMGLKNNC